MQVLCNRELKLMGLTYAKGMFKIELPKKREYYGSDTSEEKIRKK